MFSQAGAGCPQPAGFLYDNFGLLFGRFYTALPFAAALVDIIGQVMSFLDRIRECAAFTPADYVPFFVDGEAVGFVKLDFAELLAPFRDTFSAGGQGVALARDLIGAEDRTLAVRGVLLELRDRGLFPDWRDEPYPVLSAAGEVKFTLERAAVPRFGVVATGVHVNGIVRDGDAVSMWIGRRSRSKHVAPGRFDQIVAGGRPAGMTILETLTKEAEEEASIPRALARQAVPVGPITYCTERAEGLRRDVLYVYDLDLPAEFTPLNADDEIETFFLWPMQRVMETVRDTDRFKFNCALVILDFLIRNGELPPEHPDYVAISEGLRSGAWASLRLHQRE